MAPKKDKVNIKGILYEKHILDRFTNLIGTICITFFSHCDKFGIHCRSVSFSKSAPSSEGSKRTDPILLNWEIICQCFIW